MRCSRGLQWLVAAPDPAPWALQALLPVALHGFSTIWCACLCQAAFMISRRVPALTEGCSSNQLNEWLILQCAARSLSDFVPSHMCIMNVTCAEVHPAVFTLCPKHVLLAEQAEGMGCRVLDAPQRNPEILETFVTCGVSCVRRVLCRPQVDSAKSAIVQVPAVACKPFQLFGHASKQLSSLLRRKDVLEVHIPFLPLHDMMLCPQTAFSMLQMLRWSGAFTINFCHWNAGSRAVNPNI